MTANITFCTVERVMYVLIPADIPNTQRNTLFLVDPSATQPLGVTSFWTHCPKFVREIRFCLLGLSLFVQQPHYSVFIKLVPVPFLEPVKCLAPQPNTWLVKLVPKYHQHFAGRQQRTVFGPGGGVIMSNFLFFSSMTEKKIQICKATLHFSSRCF